jgi:hypothetical protein
MPVVATVERRMRLLGGRTSEGLSRISPADSDTSSGRHPPTLSVRLRRNYDALGFGQGGSTPTGLRGNGAGQGRREGPWGRRAKR